MDASYFEIFVGICVGISLAASCGFRTFLPLLVVSVAVRYYGLNVNEQFSWIGSWMAIVVLSTATIAELVAYYFPIIDNALDVINAPLVLLAGTIIMCGVLPEINPCLKWGTAVILGGGAASISKAANSVVRGVSSAFTGGLANHIISTCENVFAVVFPICAILIPVICACLLSLMLLSAYLVFKRLACKRIGAR